MRLGTRGFCRLPGHIPLYWCLSCPDLVSVRMSASVPAIPVCLFPSSLLPACFLSSHQDCHCVCVFLTARLSSAHFPFESLVFSLSFCLPLGHQAIDGVMPRGPAGPEMLPQEFSWGLDGSSVGLAVPGPGPVSPAPTRGSTLQASVGLAESISVRLCGGVQTAGAWSASS